MNSGAPESQTDEYTFSPQWHLYFFFLCPTEIYCRVWQACCRVHKTSQSDDRFASFCFFPFFKHCTVCLGFYTPCDQHILAKLWSQSLCSHSSKECPRAHVQWELCILLQRNRLLISVCVLSTSCLVQMLLLLSLTLFLLSSFDTAWPMDCCPSSAFIKLCACNIWLPFSIPLI